VFRYTLDATRTEWVSLEDEIRFVTSYLRIEQARFERRLEYRIEIDPETRHSPIPPMILQPLVENAVKHGVSSRTEGGIVVVTARFVPGADRGQLALVVEDRGNGVKSDENLHGRGIGLKNVRDRLSHLYREQAALDFAKIGSNGTRVTLTIPQFMEVRA
jgi:LytS/YehU family sensor histidine kinase